MNPMVEIIPNRLYWASVTPATVPKANTEQFVFCVDDELVYYPFFKDFGPLNMGMTYRYCRRLERLLQDPLHQNKRIIHACSVDVAKRANAACLIACFSMIALGKSANEAWLPFSNLPTPFTAYRDASYGSCTYPCTVLDCLRGLEKAMQLGWFQYKSFDITDYEFHERVENGDMNWVIPGKFLAFSGPTTHGTFFEGGLRTYTPQDYVPVFRRKNIKHIVRLNNVQYDRQVFVQGGIGHTDLYFTDGSCPSKEIIRKFLSLTEGATNDSFAVHCKAGLGRTGSLIGIYAMKHYQFPAAAFIGWARLMRPGSILGPQQQFLNEIEPEYFSLGSRITGVLPLCVKHSNDKDDNVSGNIHLDDSPASTNSGYSVDSSQSTVSSNSTPKALSVEQQIKIYGPGAAFPLSMTSRNTVSTVASIGNVTPSSGVSNSNIIPQQSQIRNNEISHNTLGLGANSKRSPIYGSLSHIAKYGDAGQGERLMEARHRLNAAVNGVSIRR